MSGAPLTTPAGISPEALDALVERLWEYGTVIGKPLSTQDACCHDAAHMIEALRSALTASEKLVQELEARIRPEGCTCKPADHRGNCPVGRKYVKAWYMRDNHTFAKIDLDTDENDIVGQVSAIFHGECGRYGSLFVRWMPSDSRHEDLTLDFRDTFKGDEVREWAQKILKLPRKEAA